MYSIGDLVMATALDISHPALSKKEIDESFFWCRQELPPAQIVGRIE